jgi:hypothetical protein
MYEKELINTMKDLTAAVLVSTIFQARHLKDKLEDTDRDSDEEIVKAVLKMWKETRQKWIP